jgi:hemerythrin-like domain-containing protein
MNNLIEELKQDHVNIKNLFVKIHEGQLSNQKKFDLLIQSKNELLLHLSKEDKYLYPALQEKARNNILLKMTLETFAKETDAVSKAINDFYNNYSSVEKINTSQFSKDLISFIIALKKRIMQEEVVIFSTYEKILKR